MNGTAMMNDYAARLDAFRKSDAERDALVSDLIAQLETLKAQYQEKADDYSNEVESRRMWQSKAALAENTLVQHRQAAAGNNFVLALIDGDGAIFQDWLFSAGKDGGADAAHQLHSEIKNQLKSTYPDANVSDWTVVVQVVLNFQGLANKLQSCGIINGPADLLAFGSAFSITYPLFSFLDVGGGKERADHKIRETLRLYVPNAQCKHIFFAPCHDNGYLTVLEPYRRDSAIASRITLIETRPAERGFIELGLKLIKLPQIFRPEDLPAAKATVGIPVRAVSSNRPNSEPLRVDHKPVSPAPSTESQASNTNPNANLASWATMGKSTPNKTISIAPKKMSSRPFIIVNAYGDRLDTKLPPTEPAAEVRYARRVEENGKYCNAHQLTGKCELGQYCDYYHGEKLSPGELLVLKHKARSRSCPYATECTDPDCTFGHVCRYGEYCARPNCYFAATHGTDLEPAKQFFDDGTEEWLPSYLAKHKNARPT